MHDEPTRRTPAEELDQMQNVVLQTLLRDDTPGLWTVAEVVTAVGDQVDAEDALMELHIAGLIHRHDQFVWPTRAAAHAMKLAEYN